MIIEIKNRFLVLEDSLSSFYYLMSGSGNIPNSNILGKFYEDDLLENRAFITSEQVRAEYLLRERKMSDFQTPKLSVIEMLKLCEKEMFPNIHELLRIVAVIPVTIATLERSYSTLKLLITYLRKTTK